MDSLTETFCLIDDFCQAFAPEWEKRLLTDGHKKRRRATSLCLSELMTLAVLFHQLRFRQFKSFYLLHAQRFLRAEFPGLPSYQRCLELLPRCIVPMSALFEAIKGECTGISILDNRGKGSKSLSCTGLAKYAWQGGTPACRHSVPQVHAAAFIGYPEPCSTGVQYPLQAAGFIDTHRAAPCGLYGSITWNRW